MFKNVLHVAHLTEAHALLLTKIRYKYSHFAKYLGQVISQRKRRVIAAEFFHFLHIYQKYIPTERIAI